MTGPTPATSGPGSADEAGRPRHPPSSRARSTAGIAAGILVVAAGVEGAAAATRAVMYGGVLVACGVTLFNTLAHDGRGRQAERARLQWLVLTGAAAGAAATVLGILVQVAATSGRGWAGLFDRDSADLVLGTTGPYGAAQRLVGLTLVAYAALRRAEGAALAPVLGCCGVVITLTSFFSSGHTLTREPRAVGFAVDLVHTSTAAVWVGGLAGLAVVLGHRRPGADDGEPEDAVGVAHVVRRFSLAASATVSLLLATGVGLSWAELAPAGGVPFNGYGLVLLAKAAVALAALAVGGVNHFVVVPAVEAGGQEAWATLSKTMRVELAAVVVLVALTGILTGLSP